VRKLDEIPIHDPKLAILRTRPCASRYSGPAEPPPRDATVTCPSVLSLGALTLGPERGVPKRAWSA
jgi:hypothetical protein